jgi:hypothetical protein
MDLFLEVFFFWIKYLIWQFVSFLQEVEHNGNASQSPDCLHCVLAAAMAQEPGEEGGQVKVSQYLCFVYVC